MRKYTLEEYNKAIELKKRRFGSLRISKILGFESRSAVEEWINRGRKPFYFSEKRIKACNSLENIRRMREMNKITQPRATKISAELRTKRLPDNAKNLTKDLAYILGVVYGDGHISVKQRKVILSAVDYDFVLNFKNILERWSGFKTRFFKRIQKPDKLIKNRKPQWRCYIDSIEASRFLKNFDLNLLLGSSEEIKCAFIEGFFDSEGGICNNRISFCNTDYFLINLVDKLLDSLNITTILKKRKYLNNLTNRLLTIYNLYVTSDCRNKFSGAVDSSISRKQERLNKFHDN